MAEEVIGGRRIDFESRPCPDCGEPTDCITLFGERAKESCGRFGCSWDGRTL